MRLCVCVRVVLRAACERGGNKERPREGWRAGKLDKWARTFPTDATATVPYKEINEDKKKIRKRKRERIEGTRAYNNESRRIESGNGAWENKESQVMRGSRKRTRESKLGC
jgi:hypothetical protein